MSPPAPASDEIAPPWPLADFVECLWRRRFPAGAPVHVQPVLPDGCLDIMSFDGGPLCLVGPETARADGLIPGGAELVGIRLRPGVGARLFGPVVTELVDGKIPLADLPRAPRLAGHYDAAWAPGAHRAHLEALLPRVAACAPDDGVAYGVAWLARHPAGTVDDLCARLGWSPREVRRRFTRAIGFGPKVMQRMVRLQRALYLAERAGGGPRLSELALGAGYADQAHMTREFRALTGETPGALLRGSFDPTLRTLFSPPGARHDWPLSSRRRAG